MKKRLTMVFGLILAILTLSMSHIYSAQSEKQSYVTLQEKLSVVKSNLREIQNTQSKNSKRIAQIQEETATLDENTSTLMTQIKALEDSSSVSARKISEIKTDVSAREEVMNKRIRAMQKMNPVSAIDFIVGSEDIMDAYKRVDLLMYICKADQELLKTMKEKRNLVETEKDQFDQKKYELLKLTSKLRDSEKVYNENLLALYMEQKNLRTDYEALDEQEELLLRASSELESVLRGYIGDQVFNGGKLLWPSPGHYQVSSDFGMRMHPILKREKMHTGIDIRASFGVPVVASGSGRVIIAEWYGSYGRTVIIDHGSGIMTLYAHNDQIEVTKGQLVKAGEVISMAGSTGMSTGPHIHFEVRKNGKPVNPMDWIGK